MKIGSNPTAKRNFVCTLDGPTSVQQIQAACNVLQGSPHPEFDYLRALSTNVTEPDPFHANVSFDYGLPDAGSTFNPNPLQRPDIWTYAVSGATVPAEAYYWDSSINDFSEPETDEDGMSALVNAAGDPLMGVTTQVGEMKVTIKGNREQFDIDEALKVSGTINEDTYLGKPPFFWQCQGISAAPKTEAVNDQEYKFYEVQVNLLYRSLGFVAKLFDTGYNVIDPELGYTRAQVKSKKDGTFANASMPVALNDDGSQTEPGEDGKVKVRTIKRRLHPAVSFNTYFGSPPTS